MSITIGAKTFIDYPQTQVNGKKPWDKNPPNGQWRVWSLAPDNQVYLIPANDLAQSWFNQAKAKIKAFGDYSMIPEKLVTQLIPASNCITVHEWACTASNKHKHN